LQKLSLKKSPAKRSSWTRIALPAEQQQRRQLQQRHWLRLHAWLTGLFTLVLGALLVTVALGGAGDFFFPQADTLAQVVRALRGH
jgi:hypothetical protein